MKIQLALIADAANISREGKLNILGEFNTLWAPSVPAQCSTLWFVAKVLLEVSDVGDRKVLLRVVDADGNTVSPPLQGKLEIGPPGDEFDGEYRAMPLVFGVKNATFPSYGTYTFELRFDDDIAAEVPLYIKQPQGVASSEA